jgi:hypothetical protein
MGVSENEGWRWINLPEAVVGGQEGAREFKAILFLNSYTSLYRNLC